MDGMSNTSRPLLIFNHNPKAGGGSILSVLRGFKPNEIKCKRRRSRAAATGSGCRPQAWHQAEQSGPDESFLHALEFTPTTLSDRRRGFVIGSIREPCAQYLSLWSFGSLGRGKFRRDRVSDDNLYGVSPPYFNTTEDRGRFGAWMRHEGVTGEVAARVKTSYGDNVIDTVDCWVFVEDFQNTLLGCLRKYAAQGGNVDWEAPTVASLIEREDDQPRNNPNHPGVVRTRTRRGLVRKDDPLGDPRPSHHGSCGDYFDEKTSREMEEGNERFVYALFGYEGCCRPGTGFSPGADITAGSNGTTTGAIQNDNVGSTPIAAGDDDSSAMVAVGTASTGVLVLLFFRWLVSAKLRRHGGSRYYDGLLLVPPVQDRSDLGREEQARSET